MRTDKKSTLIITSNARRHLYFASKIIQHFDSALIILESKREYYKQQINQSSVIKKHFENLAHSDSLLYGPVPPFPSHVQIFNTDNINSQKSFSRGSEGHFDVVCLFGTSILNKRWIDFYKDRIINLHLGLSPFYKGSATLFWPFVNEELEYLGTTIHLAEEKVDSGKILKRISPVLQRGDNYYGITSKLVKNSIDIFPTIVTGFLSGLYKPIQQEPIVGRFYRKRDFNEEQLLKALAFVGDGLTVSQLRVVEDKLACV